MANDAIQGRCGTCKHFEAINAGEGDTRPYPALKLFFAGCCRLAEMQNAEADVDSDWEEDPPTHTVELDKAPLAFRVDAAKMACSLDGSNYMASLLVKADFGCTEWAAR